MRANDYRTSETYLKERFRRLRQKSKKNGIKFELTYEDIIALWESQKGLWFYTRKKMLTIEARDNAFDSASFDKIVPEKGYVKGNVVLCTTRANAIKSSCSLEEMQEWLPAWHDKIVDYLNKFSATRS